MKGKGKVKMLTYNKGWRAAARCLDKLGYRMVPRDGVVPATFEQAGRDTLYLVRPVIDEAAYDFQYVPDGEGVAGTCGLIDQGSEKLILYMPEGRPVAADGKTWVPRLWNSRPRLGYSIRDAAEHAGLTINSIKSATFRNARHPLVPTQHVGAKRIALFDEETLATWMASRRVGATRGPAYRTRRQLAQSGKDRLERIVRNNIEHGDTKMAGRLVDAIQGMNGRTVDQWRADIKTPSGLDDAMALASTNLDRATLIDIAAID
ncbi:MAG: hypothetical protein KDE24_09205 [Caldilinea sp.]|nr:hypothetical protein [Caldilinea sp.]